MIQRGESGFQPRARMRPGLAGYSPTPVNGEEALVLQNLDVDRDGTFRPRPGLVPARTYAASINHVSTHPSREWLMVMEGGRLNAFKAADASNFVLASSGWPLGQVHATLGEDGRPHPYYLPRYLDLHPYDGSLNGANFSLVGGADNVMWSNLWALATTTLAQAGYLEWQTVSLSAGTWKLRIYHFDLPQGAIVMQVLIDGAVVGEVDLTPTYVPEWDWFNNGAGYQQFHDSAEFEVPANGRYTVRIRNKTAASASSRAYLTHVRLMKTSTATDLSTDVQDLSWHFALHPAAHTAESPADTWGYGTGNESSTTDRFFWAVYNSPSSAGQYIEYPFWLPAGTYNTKIAISGDSGSGGGIITTTVDGVSIGDADVYAVGGNDFAEVALSPVTLSADATRIIRFAVNSKNPSSSDYDAYIYRLLFTRTA